MIRFSAILQLEAKDTFTIISAVAFGAVSIIVSNLTRPLIHPDFAVYSLSLLPMHLQHLLPPSRQISRAQVVSRY